mgnify:CR=1 FL=1
MTNEVKTIQNPIIRGFNPDPDIIRVGDDFYIVNSTFEWFPGYQIHHSKDLQNWRLVSRPLDKVSMLDLKGIPDSGGVWAPGISYNHTTALFYLPYTNVRTFDGPWKDTPNFLTTSTSMKGPWSEPMYLNSSGFDGDFFHDDDGTSWFINMIVDHRKGKFFGGIVIQQFCHEQHKLIGEPKNIFEGTDLGGTEGPHIYKRNGFYYLLTAEGGTEYGHAMTICRSRDLLGPYELHPDNPIITSRNNPEARIQKTGHGGFIELQDGQWYTTFLCARPLTQRGRCITGRETGLEQIEWRDDWPYLAYDGKVAREFIPAPNLPEHKFDQNGYSTSVYTEFNGEELDFNFQSLRIPMTSDWINQTDRAGFLRLYGRESLSSTFEQSLIARRVQAHHITAETCVEFSPNHFQQMAGLVCYYNTYHYHYIHITGSECGEKKIINVLSCDKLTTGMQSEPVEVTGADRLYLKVHFNGAELQFYYATTKDKWLKIGSTLDGSELSDDYVRDSDSYYRPAFTGAFVGICCQDFTGQKTPADFAYFSYNEI